MVYLFPTLISEWRLLDRKLSPSSNSFGSGSRPGTLDRETSSELLYNIDRVARLSVWERS